MQVNMQPDQSVVNDRGSEPGCKYQVSRPTLHQSIITRHLLVSKYGALHPYNDKNQMNGVLGHNSTLQKTGDNLGIM